MFIVEGLGQRVARQWGERIQAQLGLPAEAVSFFLYHSESDVQHLQRLDHAIAAGILTDKLVADIVRCAKVTARLYALQLEENRPLLVTARLSHCSFWRTTCWPDWA